MLVFVAGVGGFGLCVVSVAERCAVKDAIPKIRGTLLAHLSTTHDDTCTSVGPRWQKLSAVADIGL